MWNRKENKKTSVSSPKEVGGRRLNIGKWTRTYYPFQKGGRTGTKVKGEVGKQKREGEGYKCEKILGEVLHSKHRLKGEKEGFRRQNRQKQNEGDLPDEE